MSVQGAPETGGYRDIGDCRSVSAATVDGNLQDRDLLGQAAQGLVTQMLGRRRLCCH